MRARTAATATAAFAALALAVFPAAANAFGRPGHGPGEGPAERILRMSKVLGLSDDQTSRIQSIAGSRREGAMGRTAASMRSARETLATTIHDMQATDDQVRDAAAALAALEAEAAVLRHRMAIEILSVLTPDQRAKLTELRASFKNRHEDPTLVGPPEN
jgi:Spy/CpxP family protein refolding chaperone